MAHHIASPAAIEKSLKGINFPSSKQQLLQHAREHGADQDVMSTLNQFSDRQYQSAADVATEIGKLK